MMNTPMKFAFLDEGEALRRLGVDRDTLLAFVTAKRLRTYPGVGKGNFFRAKDLEALYAELHAGEEDVPETPVGEVAPPGRKLFDPAYKVHVRLQADLKWYDLEDEDLKAWAREMTPDGYARQRQNIEMVIAKLRRMRELMDETAASWQHLPGPRTAPAGTETPAEQAEKPAPARTHERRRDLPVLGGMTGPTTTTSTPPTAPAQPRTKRPRRDLPMLGNTAEPETSRAE